MGSKTILRTIGSAAAALVLITISATARADGTPTGTPVRAVPRFSPSPFISATPISPVPIVTSPISANTTIPIPCSTHTTIAKGLRQCSVLIPQIISQINQMMQRYDSCYYQGIDLDTSLAVPAAAAGGFSCQGNNFGTACSLVPNKLNGNISELSTQNSLGNGKSCGKPMPLTVSVAACATPTAEESAVLAANGLKASDLDNMNQADAQALLLKVSKTNPNVVSSATGGKKWCMNFDASGTTPTGNGSLERAYFRGTYLQALSYYTDTVENQISCLHTINVANTACQAFATQVANLGTSTTQIANQVQSELQGQVNIADIDACNTNTFNTTVVNNARDPGQLRQSAQHLCSARTSLETAVTQLAMCDIFSQTQQSYIASTGNPATQLGMMYQMMKDLDPPCRKQCYNMNSLSTAQTCLNSCYQQMMPGYLQNKFQALWPQPTQLLPASSCVTGGN